VTHLAAPASAVRGLFATVLLLLASTAFAQETRESELPDLEEEVGIFDYMKLRFTLANRWVGKADFGAFEGSSVQPEARLRLDVPVSRNAAIRLMGTGRMIIYDFDGQSDLFPGAPTDEPFDNLNSFDVRLQAGYLLDERFTLFSENERWALLAQGGVKASWEKGSKLEDGLRGRGSLAVGYRLAERLEVAAGITLSERMLKSGIGVGPLLEFDWRVNDDWTLKSYGLGLQIERRLVEKLLLFTRVRLESQGFRLDERPGIGRGKLSLRQLPVGLGVQWNPLSLLRFRAIVGAMTLQRLRVKNEQDNTVNSETAGVSPYVTVRLDLRF